MEQLGGPGNHLATGLRTKQADKAYAHQQRGNRRPVNQAPRQARADREDCRGIGGGALFQVGDDPLDAVLGGVFGLLDPRVLGLTSFRPLGILELRNGLGRTQPSQIVSKPIPGQFDVSLERLEVGPAHRSLRPDEPG